VREDYPHPSGRFDFAFSDRGGLRRILGLLLGVSIAVTATSFGVAFFGFDGGAGW
jgi:type IV secretory pathway VirB2 component (pilin)